MPPPQGVAMRRLGLTTRKKTTSTSVMSISNLQLNAWCAYRLRIERMPCVFPLTRMGAAMAAAAGIRGPIGRDSYNCRLRRRGARGARDGRGRWV